MEIARRRPRHERASRNRTVARAGVAGMVHRAGVVGMVHRAGVVRRVPRAGVAGMVPAAASVVATAAVSRAVKTPADADRRAGLVGPKLRPPERGRAKLVTAEEAGRARRVPWCVYESARAAEAAAAMHRRVRISRTYKARCMISTSTGPSARCRNARGTRPTTSKPCFCHKRTAPSLLATTKLNCTAL
jgi:hypothetical protein